MPFKAHFDGKVIVPDEPVDLPAGQPLEVVVRTAENSAKPGWDRVAARAHPNLNVPAEALQREALYEGSPAER